MLITLKEYCEKHGKNHAQPVRERQEVHLKLLKKSVETGLLKKMSRGLITVQIRIPSAGRRKTRNNRKRMFKLEHPLSAFITL